MTAKKIPVDIATSPRYRTELETLYARRSAIDALIKSMKEYDRYRAKKLDNCNLKTA
jgi:hypothetical protein